MEKYNQKKLQELLQASGKTRADFRRGMNNLDDRIAKNYLAGGDLSVGKLLMAARWFGVSVLDFFEVDGAFAGKLQSAGGNGKKEQGANGKGKCARGEEQEESTLVQPYVTATTEALLASERKEHEKELSHMQEMMSLRIGYERKLAALERENALLKEALEKNTDGAVGHPVVRLIQDNSEDYYSAKVAEDEDGL